MPGQATSKRFSGPILSDRRLVGLSVMLSAALGLVCAMMLYDARLRAYERAVQAAGNTLAALEHDIGHNLQLIDTTLMSTRDLARTLPAGSDTMHVALLRQANVMRASVSGFESLLIIDAAGAHIDGLPARASRSGYLDRDYVAIHRQTTDSGLYISRPFPNPAQGGEWDIALSRRIDGQNGGFAGAVVAILRLVYFRDLFATMAIGPHDTIELFRTDGTVLMQRPVMWDTLGVDRGTDPSVMALLRLGRQHGTDHAVLFDRSRKLFVAARIGVFPVVVAVGLSIRDVLMEWRHRTLAIGMIALALCGLLAWLALMLRHELYRRMQAERDARASELRYRMIAENVGDIVMHVGSSGQIYVSPSVRDVLGFSPEELAGWKWIATIHPDDQPRLQTEIAAVRTSGAPRTVEYRVHGKDGTLRWLEAHIRPMRDGAYDAEDGVLINARDVTRRKQAEDTLAQIATTDALTGLPNRRRFDEVLDQEWRRAMREEQPISLIMLDADWFKSYNDQYGHQRGDELLRSIARATAEHVRRPGDFAGRYGGEEFAVILPATEPNGAFQVAEQIRSAVLALQTPHRGTPNGIATISAGIACMLPQPALLQTQLIEAADQALYAAKRAGRDRTETARSTIYPPHDPGLQDGPATK